MNESLPKMYIAVTVSTSDVSYLLRKVSSTERVNLSETFGISKYWILKYL